MSWGVGDFVHHQERRGREDERGWRGRGRGKRVREEGEEREEKGEGFFIRSAAFQGDIVPLIVTCPVQ